MTCITSRGGNRHTARHHRRESPALESARQNRYTNPLHTASADRSHACASRLYGEGIGLAAIQQLLGHRWLSTTVRYVHVADEAIELAYEQAAERAAARFKEV